MTTQNSTAVRATFANLVAGTYFYPDAAGIDGDGFDNIAVRLKLVSGDVNNTLTATVESDNGVAGTFEWDESLGLRDWRTGATGIATWVANNATTRARLEQINHNAKKWRVRLVVAWAVGANHSGVVEIRLNKV